jgi:hypothetical protein
MNYKILVKDFAKRTNINLRIIEKNKICGNESYEVTQLINSCLGLLVFPREKFFNSIPETQIEELEKQGWVIPEVSGNFPQVENLKQLLRYLRNAIAHFNIEFISDSEDQIQTIKVWNNYRGRKTWEAILGIEELKSILEKFTELIDEKF